MFKKNISEKFRIYSAFTIIELIIALIIFGIGLLLVLSVLNKNIGIVQKISITTKATLLAKDQMAIFYNFRDSNNIKYRKWNYITGAVGAEEYFTGGECYKVWTDLSGYQNKIERILNPNFLNTRLYYDTGTIVSPTNVDVYTGFHYTYKNTGKETDFARYVELTGAYIDKEVSHTSNELVKILSIVKYQHGALTGDIVLESFISNWK